MFLLPRMEKIEVESGPSLSSSLYHKEKSIPNFSLWL